METTAERIIRLLKLEPLRHEGGYFREVYRSRSVLAGEALPPEFSGQRSLATAIYYLLTPDTFSALHRLKSDEVYHFYAGDPVQMLQLRPGGHGEVLTLGTDLEAGMRPQIVVPGGVWQGSRLRAGKGFALMGTTVAPGFEPPDFELGAREALRREYPAFAELIRELTRD